MKRFFNKLDKELQSAVPKMSDDLKDMPIAVAREQGEEITARRKTSFSFAEFFTPKRIGAFATAFVLVFIAVFSIITFAGKQKVSDTVILKVDINPSLELILDEDMKVERVVSANEDGDIILKLEGFANSLIGKDYNEAVTLIATKATELGFIDYKNQGSQGSYNKISVTATGNEEELPEGIFENITNSLNEYFYSSGLYVYVECAKQSSKQFNAKMEEVSNKAQLYYDGLKSDAVALKEYLSELIFDYCEVLLTHSLNKYDLLTEITNLNDKIKEKQDSFIPLGYWSYSGEDQEILALCKQVEEKLELLYKGYGMQITGEVELLTATLIYSSDINYDGLRELASSGINENLFSFNNELLGDFIRISAESFISDVVEFYGEIASSEANDLLSVIDLLITKLEGVRTSASVRPELSVITAENYQAFINRIGVNG